MHTKEKHERISPVHREHTEITATHMQWLIAKGVSAVYQYTRIQQQLEYILIAMQRSQVKRRLPILIFRIEIPIATFEQFEDYFTLIFTGRTMQEISHTLTACVVRRRISNKWHR